MGARCSYAHGETEMKSLDRFKVQTMTFGPELVDNSNDAARFYREL